MKIINLSITNFKAIRSLELSDLRDTVVVAGANGCGKSCVFDAIRLLKSAYGAYQANEWQSWMGEQAINLNKNKSDSLRVLQDRTQPLRVAADFALSPSETAYLTENAESICRDYLWRDQTKQPVGMPAFVVSPLSSLSVAASARTYQRRVEKDVRAMATELVEELKKSFHAGAVTIDTAGDITAQRSIPLELIFSRYDPQNVGIIDYHSSTRNYGRQSIDSVKLNIDTSNDHLKQHALYNSANKYSNLKTEMASSYIRQLLIGKSGEEQPLASLGETLDELFKTFFPGKAFLGPQPTPNGQLLFHVRLPNGAEHDIDELSAGEKEVLYGYLRLRNSTPQNSMILIDEPELHLNPRLISGLAGFYHKHLSKAMNNQLWLVTHSDTLIREAVENEDFSVFHMQPAAQLDAGNQATNVQIREEFDRLLIELIGDLAAYRPAAKMVLFEGGGDSDFDVRVVSTLFPEFSRQTNCISAGNKRRVSQLYDLLERSREAGHIPGRFYAITDSDEDASGLRSPASTRQWAAYHIENYLLEPSYILKVLVDLNRASSFNADPNLVTSALRGCAERTIPALVRHRLQNDANHTLQRAAELSFDQTRADVASALTESLERILSRMQSEITSKLSHGRLQETAESVELTARSQLASGEWLEKFRGRDVMRNFVGEFGGGIKYESFRDLILARMRYAAYKPTGMATVLNEIIEDRPSSMAQNR